MCANPTSGSSLLSARHGTSDLLEPVLAALFDAGKDREASKKYFQYILQTRPKSLTPAKVGEIFTEYKGLQYQKTGSSDWLRSWVTLLDRVLALGFVEECLSILEDLFPPSSRPIRSICQQPNICTHVATE